MALASERIRSSRRTREVGDGELEGLEDFLDLSVASDFH